MDIITKIRKTLKLYQLLAVILILSGISLLLVPSVPQLWYTINTSATQTEINTLTTFSSLNDKYHKESTMSTLPPFDKSLSKKNIITIPKINMQSVLSQESNAEEALKYGAWMVDNFPSPSDLDNPIIIASHRFGYISWSNDKRNKESFYNLPKTKEGDTVEIVWEQRLYKYKIYKSEESTKISDYNADLILYTCKTIQSPLRIFRYAKRTN